MSDVMTELEPIRELFVAGRYREALSALAAQWEKLPAPRHEASNSYLCVAYGVAIAQKAGDLDTAWDWAQRGLAYSGGVNLAGESEFLVAEVAFARGDLEQAAHFFRLVRKNSGRRLFRDKNPRYWELTA
jgi:hypothetical protein